jgi:D-methionine transport system permease protein
MSTAMLFEFLNATWETIYMVILSGLIAIILGLPLGVILLVTRNAHISENKYVNMLIGSIVNAIRSIPFIILLVALIPFTRLIIGTSIGTTAAIIPLSVAAIPFFGRIVESALSEVSAGLLEVGHAMGATPLQIISKILIPEAMPAIINGITLMLINLIGYSAMAGAIGGGGLGDLAIRYGYQRFDIEVMLATIVILIVMVQCLQWLGDLIAKKLVH